MEFLKDKVISLAEFAGAATQEEIKTALNPNSSEAGYANAIELMGSGSVVLTLMDGRSVTLGATTALPANWFRRIAFTAIVSSTVRTIAYLIKD